MNQTIKIILIACFVLGFAALSHTNSQTARAEGGIIYYVDIETGDDSFNGQSRTNDGNSVGPWQHLPGTVGFTGTGWRVLQDGDIVYVKGDTINPVQVGIGPSYYNGSPKYDSIKIIGGQFANPAWGTNKPIFDEEGVRTFGFWVGWPGSSGSAKGITIDGLEIKNTMAGAVGPGFDTRTGSAGIDIGGNSLVQFTTVRRSYIHDTLRSIDDTGHGIETGHGDHLIIEYNTIGPRIGTKGVESYDTDYTIVRNNFISGSGDHGMVISSARSDVYNNIIEMIPPFVHDTVYAFKADGGQYSDFWNNIVFHRGPQLPSPSYDRSQGIGVFDLQGNRFYNNTVYNFAVTANGGRYGPCIAIGAEGLIAGVGASNNFFENNLTYNCRNDKNIQLWLNTGTSNNSIKFNNFFYQNITNKVMEAQTSAGVITDYTVSDFNNISLPNGNVALNNVQFNPNFLGGTMPTGLDQNYQPNTDYFKLTSATDPLILSTGNRVAGDSTHGYSSDPNKFAYDISGNFRINWSMGAYEYQSATVPTPVNGSCSTSLNTCSNGTFLDTTDSTTNYLWNCLGSDGGSTANCSLIIPVTPPTDAPVNGSCSTSLNICAAGTFADVADTAESYLWSCSGLNGGSAAACSLTKASSDTTKPTISLTAPLTGANHSKTIVISASAGDPIISGQVGSGLAGVQFRLDGVNLGQEDTDYPYSINWDTSGSTNGTHSLDAIARDGAGNTQVSQIVTVTIANADAPVNIVCTTFNYSTWTNCEPSKTQSRYILSRGPQGCSGGVADILIQNCTYTAPDKELTNAVVVGFCGFTPDSCPSGVFSKIDNTTTSYRWKCAGANGGNTAFCSLPLNSAAVIAKLAADKKAAASQTNPLNPPLEGGQMQGGQNAIVSFSVTNTALYNKLKGKIILRVESKGEAYYISPKEKIAYYLGRPSDAFRVMREQGLGITNADLAKIQIADKEKTNANQTFADKQKGKILLQVESKGEAWYVNPNNGQRYFLSRPADAFNAMRKLGLGISEADYERMGGK